MLGEESPVFFMGSKRCVPVKIGKLNGDTLKVSEKILFEEKLNSVLCFEC